MQVGKDSKDFKKLKWTLRPKGVGYPSKRWGHTAAVHEGNLLIYGGHHGGNAREGMYKINCESLEATTICYENVPEVRESHSCNLIKDNMFIFGGCIHQDLTYDLLQFRVAEPGHYWRKIEQQNLIPLRESHVSLALNDTHILVYGGTTPDEVMLDDFWILNIETATWQQVTDIKGTLKPKIGCTMTLLQGDVLVFGGQFGEGEESQYSNDFYRLHFESNDFSRSPTPKLAIQVIEVSGPRPTPRTGHSCVQYKERLLFIIGGQGVLAKRAVLYNDIWTFDLRTSSWTELLVQNRSNFRPRSNFTANLYKNTIYIFGGFVNLVNYKCTDEFVTLTIFQNRHSTINVEECKNTKVQQLCPTCKFQFLSPVRPTVQPKNQHRLVTDNSLICSLGNVVRAAKSISSSFEALGLLVSTIGKFGGQLRKQIRIDLRSNSINDTYQTQTDTNSFLHIATNGVVLTKQVLQNLIYTYDCEKESGFDLKNSLLRLGREVMVCYVLENDTVLVYLFLQQIVYRFIFHVNSIFFEITQRPENNLLLQFLERHGLELRVLTKPQLLIVVASLSCTSNGVAELRKSQNGCQLQCSINSQTLIFSEFMREYFLETIPATLFLSTHKLELIAYSKSLKHDKRIEPLTEEFLVIRLLLEPNLSSTRSSFIKIYLKNRRVGVYSRYPFISGYVELINDHYLNFARTRCEMPALREMLQAEIRCALQESRKRPACVSPAFLEKNYQID